jgi:hypothetical protein
MFPTSGCWAPRPRVPDWAPPRAIAGVLVRDGSAEYGG